MVDNEGVSELRHAEQRAQRTARRMRAIATAAGAVVGARSESELLDVLEEACRRVVPFDELFLLRYDAASHTFRDVGSRSPGGPGGPEVFSAAGRPAERVVRERRTHVIDAADPLAPGAGPGGAQGPPRSAIRAPILAGDEVLGVISIRSFASGVYGPEEVEVAEVLAALAATALENLRLAEEQGEAARALQESQQQLQHAQKMEAVGRLAGGIAHDFNNILMAIGGHAELLRTDPLLGEQTRWHADEIKRAADRASSLTHQLLAYSRKQVLQPRPVNLNGVVSEMEGMLRRLIGEHVRLQTALDPGLGVVRADAGQLAQVIMNLAVNARDAMPEGGTLTIATRNEGIPPGETRLGGEVPSGIYVVLAVSDTGVGMDAFVTEHIFEPFFTTKPAGKGTGLGLATVHGIVHQSGGAVGVLSVPGRGSTFEIYLPRADAVSEAAPAPATPPAGRGDETILLVEDDRVVRVLISMVLEREGYRVLQAGDGEAALRIARGHDGRIHLLLTDVVMPGMNGHTLSGRLREIRPDARVAYMSGYTDDAIEHHGVLEPGTELIQKPVSPNDLIARVRAILR